MMAVVAPACPASPLLMACESLMVGQRMQPRSLKAHANTLGASQGCPLGACLL